MSAFGVGGSLFLLCLPFSGIGAGILLFFVGFFNGPVYPNLMHLVPQLFGREKAQSLMGSFLAFACLGITLAPPLFGLLASRLGFGVFAFGLLAVFFPFCFTLPRSALSGEQTHGKDCT